MNKIKASKFFNLFIVFLCFVAISSIVIPNPADGHKVIIKILPQEYSLIGLFGFLGTAIVYFLPDKPEKKTYIFSSVIVIVLLILDSINYFGSFAGILSNYKSILFFIFRFIFLTIIFSKLFIFLKSKILVNWKHIKYDKTNFPQTLFFCCSVIFFCWFPFLLIFFPGSPAWDGLQMLDVAFGIFPPSNHHPYYLSLLLALPVRLRTYVGDTYAFGLLLVNLIAFQVLCYGLGCVFFIRSRLSITPKIYPFFFGIVPLFPLYAQAILKDSLYAASFFLFISIICYIFFPRLSINSKITWGVFALSCFFLCYSRHNGPYVVFPTLLLIWIYLYLNKLQNSKKVFIILSTLFLCISFTNNYLLNKLEVEPSLNREKFSILGQMTGRAVVENFDKLTQDDIKEIQKIIPDYKVIPKLYNPNFYDPIKNSMKFETSPKEILSLTFKLCKKFPKSCLKGAINQSYLYFYPFNTNKIMPHFYDNITQGIVNTGFFKFQYVLPQKIRNLISSYGHFWINEIPLSLITRPALGSALAIVCLILGFLSKNAKLTLISLPINLSLFLNLLSPVNGDFRYALPILSVFPILFSIVILFVKKNDV